ncbi:uncharacterized protein LOC122030374 [Zingiber officinale]|nr:uncharacterized protein LOC122030374 [Zingiber officinale]
MQPTEVNTRNMLDGSVSLQFDQYQAASLSDLPKYNAKDEEIQSDEEEVARHSIAVFIEEGIPEELLVKRTHSLAQIPMRRTAGAAGYDISITHAQDIPALGRSLLSTGLCIQIPHNAYGRIAPRSSSAMRGIIIMGGVIDADYRGEVKVMAFNTTNEDIFLNKQECIAQIILERITTPEVKEVEQLGLTERGTSGFGSTTQTQVCTSSKANPECLGCHYCCSGEEDAATYDAYVAPTHKGKQKEVIAYIPTASAVLRAVLYSAHPPQGGGGGDSPDYKCSPDQENMPLAVDSLQFEQLAGSSAAAPPSRVPAGTFAFALAISSTFLLPLPLSRPQSL